MDHVSKISVMAWIICIVAIVGHYYVNKIYRQINTVIQSESVKVFNACYLKPLRFKIVSLKAFTTITLFMVVLDAENIYLTTFYCFSVVMVIWETRDHLDLAVELQNF